MTNIVKLKRTSVPGRIPSTGDIGLGEVALNTADGRIFLKKEVGGVQSIVTVSNNYLDLVNTPSEYSFNIEGDNNQPRTISKNQTIQFVGTDGIGVDIDTLNNVTLSFSASALITDIDVVGDDLVITLGDNSSINAGNVRGPAGPAGATGPAGAGGAAATISVGSTTTGAAGTSASVTNSGTTSAAVFDFTIPSGATGPTGPAGPAGPQGSTGTFTNRVVSYASGSTLTINGDTTDMAVTANTEAIGTLTIAQPSGTPTNGQKLLIRIQSTNSQTLSWNSIFQGNTTNTLPTSTTGNNKYDYLGLIYNSTAAKWHLLAKMMNF